MKSGVRNEVVAKVKPGDDVELIIKAVHELPARK